MPNNKDLCASAQLNYTISENTDVKCEELFIVNIGFCLSFRRRHPFRTKECIIYFVYYFPFGIQYLFLDYIRKQHMCVIKIYLYNIEK